MESKHLIEVGKLSSVFFVSPVGQKDLYSTIQTCKPMLELAKIFATFVETNC